MPSPTVQPQPAKPASPAAMLARQLRTLCWGFAVFVTTLTIALAVLQPEYWSRSLATAGGVALFCLAAGWLGSRQRPVAGARLLVAGLLLIVAGLSWTGGGIHAPAVTAFFPIVLIAGVLLGLRTGLGAAGCAAGWALWVVCAELAGWLPPTTLLRSTEALALIATFNLSLLALTLWLTTEELRVIRAARRQAAEDQRRIEAALVVSEERLALALEAATDGIFDIDLATGSVYCSPRYFTMLGYGPHELPASFETWRSLLHPDDRPGAEQAMARYLENRADHHSIETRLRAKDGSWRWILSRGRIAERTPDGAPRRLIGTHVDITAQKQAEHDLRQAKDFAERLIATANAIIVCLDPEGRVVVFNPTAEATTGYTAAELTGRSWFEILTPRERFPQVWEEFERLQAGGTADHFENPILTKGGEERIIAWRNGVLREGDAVVGTIGFGIDVTEQRRAEHALAKERDLVARLVETSPAGILVVDLSGQVVFANTEAERILDLQRLGTPAHSYRPIGWNLLTPEGDPVPEADRTFRRVLTSGQPLHGVRHLLVWPTGRRVLLSINAAPLFDAAGRAEGVVATIDDITERQRAEATLRENEERLRSIVDHAPFGSHLYELTAEGRLVFQAANQSADTMLGIDHRKLAGREIVAAFPGLAGTDLPDTYRQVVTSGRPYHRAQVDYDADGIRGAFDVHALPIGQNRLVVFFADITERQRAEAALRHSEEQYRRLFNSGNDAIFVHGFRPDGQPDRFTQVNDIACQMLGFSREELLARSPAELNSPARRESIAGIVHRLHTEHHALFDMELVTRNGHLLPVEINSNVFELDGRPTVLSVVRDISERHRLEEQLRQAQKMEVFGQLAGGVAHDFNNLLVAIIGNAELLIESPAFAGRPREQLEQIQEAGRRAAALTRQLLLFARKQPPQPVPGDLNAIVGHHLKLLRRIIGEDIELVVELSPEALPVVADVNMVEQVAMNLVVNARDAMPGGGRLTVRTALAALDAGTAARCACPPGRYAALTIADTGTGIPAELRGRIFEPFFTTKPVGHGTGLGLATVLGIVQQHRGGIALDSQEGRGSAFTIYLPVASTATASPPATPPETPPAAASASLLVVEDDVSVRAVIDHTLRRAGYSVRLANSAAEALELLEGDNTPLDLVLSDVVMPGGIDGVQLAARLATLRPGLPVRLMSGYAKDLEHASGHVLQKPFSTVQLLAFIREGLGR